jgi:hypothetical protein
MTVRNRRARGNAMLLRGYVFNILRRRTLLEPLTDKELAAMLDNHYTPRQVGRARRWVEQEWRRNQLADFSNWANSARQDFFASNSRTPQSPGKRGD